jgi:autotransporter-associated beta strand protein
MGKPATGGSGGAVDGQYGDHTDGNGGGTGIVPFGGHAASGGHAFDAHGNPQGNGGGGGDYAGGGGGGAAASGGGPGGGGGMGASGSNGGLGGGGGGSNGFNAHAGAGGFGGGGGGGGDGGAGGFGGGGGGSYNSAGGAGGYGGGAGGPGTRYQSYSTVSAGGGGLGAGGGAFVYKGGTLTVQGSFYSASNLVRGGAGGAGTRYIAGGSGGAVGSDFFIFGNTTFAPFSGQNQVIYGSVGGPGALVLNGGIGGTLELRSANTFAGGTQLDEGLLIVDNVNSLSASTPTGTRNVQGTIVNTTNAVRFNGGDLELNTSGTISNAIVLNAFGGIANNQQNVTLSGAITSGTFAPNTQLVFSGNTGVTTLTGANTYSNGTWLDTGTVAIGNGSELGTGEVDVVDNSTLQFNNSFTLANNFDIANVNIFSPGFTPTATFNTQGFNDTLSGAIFGAGILAKTGTGTLTLNGGNSYSAGTDIEQGTIAVNGAGALGSGQLSFTGSGALQFNAGFTLDNSVAISSGVTATINTQANNDTINGGVTGAGALTKTGSGTLTLIGASDYSGATTVSQGTLQAGAANSFSANSDVTVASGATLALNNFNESIGSLAGVSGSSVTLGAGVLTTGGDNASTTYAGTITGTGGLTKTGSGVFTLSGANSGFSGAVAISGGQIDITADNNLGNGSGTNTLTLSNGGGLQFGASFASGRNLILGTGGGVLDTQSFSDTLNGQLSGSDSLTKNGSGVLTLTGNNSGFSGAVIVAAGKIDITADNNLGSGGGTNTLTLSNGGGLQYGGSFTSQRGIILGTGGGVLDTNGNNDTAAGSLSGSGALTKVGGGVLLLDADNRAYSGAITVTGGEIGFSFDTNLGDSSVTNTLTLNGGGLQFVDNFTSHHSIAIGAGGGTLDTQGFNDTLAGALTGSGGLTKTGSGTLTLSAANTGFSGAVSINAGLIGFSADNNLGNGSGGNTVTLNGGGLQFDASFTSNRSIAIGAGGGTLATQGFNDTLAGALTGSGALTKTGSGVLTLSANNSGYSGAVTVNAGELSFSADNNLGNGSAGNSLTLNNGASLQFGAGFTSTHAITLGTGGGTLDTQGFTDTVSGNIGGSGSLTKTGSGTLILAGTDSYSGGTTISAGTLQGDTGSLRGAIADNAALVFSQTFNGTYSGALTGSGTLTKQNTGVVILSGDNSGFSGAVSVTGGELGISANNNLGSSSTGNTLTLSGGGGLQFEAGFVLHHFITLGAGGGTLDTQGFTDTAAFAISGTGGLTKTGSGTLILTDANTYSGGTTISAGTLQGDTGSLQGAIADNAALVFDQAFDGTYAGTLTGAGTLTKQRSGVVTLSADNSGFSGAVSVTGGELGFSADNNLGDGSAANTVTLSGGGGLQFETSFISGRSLILGAGGGVLDTNGNNDTVGGAITGAGGLTKAGLGTLTLTGANSYTGVTDVSVGTLQAGAADTFSSSSAVTVETGAMLDLNSYDQAIGSLAGAGGVTLGSAILTTGGDGTSTTFSGTLTGGAASGLTKTGAGIFTLSADASGFSGAVTVSGGEINFSDDANLGDGSASNTVTLKSGGGLQFGASFTTSRDLTLGAGGGTVDTNGNDDTVSGIISGAGGLTKTGLGTLTLTGANDYTGATDVSVGTLQAGATDTFSSGSAVTVESGATLDLNSYDQVIGSLAGAGGVTLGSAILTTGGDNTSTTFSGTLTGDGTSGLTKTGSGVFTLAGDASGFSGAVAAVGGEINFSADANLGDGSASNTVTLSSGGGLQFGASFTTSRDLTLGTGGGVLDTNGNDDTVGGSITGSGGLTKTGLGTLTLTGANSFTGATDVSVGTLQAGAVDTFSSSSAVTVETGATLDLNSYDQAIGSLAGAGGVTLGTATLTTGGDNTSTTFSGTLTGDGDSGLTKTGTGTLSLTGDNSGFSGAVGVNGGDLDIVASNNLGDSSATNVVTLSSGGALQFGAGGVTVSQNLTLGAGDGAIDTNGHNDSVSGAITGDGGLTKTGLGTLTLSGANSYTGATDVSVGTLQAGATDAFSSGSAVTVETGATLDLNDYDQAIGSLAGSGGVTLGTATLTTGGDGTSTLFSGAITGGSTSGLVKTGSGTFSLTGDNSGFSGGVSVNGGDLNIVAANNLGDSSATNILTLSSGGGLQFGAGSVTVTQNLTLGSGGGVIDTSGHNDTVGGVISGSGALTKTGLGALTLTGANSYTGATDVSVGVLQAGATAAFSSSSAVTVETGATLDLNSYNQAIGSLAGAGGVTLGSATLTTGGDGTSTLFSGTITGGSSSGLVKTGSGVFSLTGDNSGFSGAVGVNGGDLNIIAANNLGDSSSTNIVTLSSGGALQFGAASVTVTQNLTLGTGGGVIDTNGHNDGVSGVISGSGALTKTGLGTLTLTGANDYTGATEVGAGTLQAGAMNTFSSSSAVTVDNGATLDLHSYGQTIGSLAGAGGVTLGSATLTAGGNGTSTLFSGAITGGSASGVVKTGAGTLSLTGDNSGFSGALGVNGGDLNIIAANNLGDSSATNVVTLSSGGALQFGAGGVTVTQNLTLGAGGGAIDTNGHNDSVSGVISGSGNLTKIGLGTLTLTGANSYTGATDVSVGTLQAGATDSFSSGSAITVDTGATLDLNSYDQAIGSLAGAGGVTLGSATLTAGGNGTSTLFSGTLTGGSASGLTKTGSGVFSLTGDNSGFSGAVGINGGDLNIIAANNLGDSSATNVVTLSSGGALQFGAGSVTVTQNLILGSGGGAVDTNGHNDSVGGVISGSGALTKTGLGTLTLTGANDYSGATDVSVGTLQAGATDTFSSGSAVTVETGAILDLNNYSQAIGSLAGAGGVTLGSATLTAGGDNTSTTFSGGISGSGALVKTGTGTLILTGANSYGGGTTVSGGVLQGDTTSLQGDITDNAAVTFNQAAAGTYAGAIGGSGTLTKIGAGTLTLTGANDYTGATSVNVGTLRAGATGAFAAGSAFTVASGATLDLNSIDQTVGSLAGAGAAALGSANLTTGGDNTSTTFSGAITGTGGLIKVGTGAFTLSGTNGYTGATGVDAGTLKAGAADSFAAGSAVTVASGATLNLNGFDETIASLAGAGSVTLGSGTLTTGGNDTSTTFSGGITGTGGLIKVGTGVFTLSGTNGYTGATSVSVGTLQAGAANAFAGASAVTVAGGANLDLNSFNEAIGSLAGAGAVTLGSGTLTTGGDNTSTVFFGGISGSSGVVKTGTGVFTLSGINGYTGSTNVNAGVLKAGASGSFAAGSAVTVASGATLNLNSFDETIASLAGAGSAALGSATLTTGDATSTAFSGGITGTGRLIKVGTGVFTLSGANGYTGATSVSAGTLQAGAINSLAGASAVTVAGGATLDLNSFNQAVGSLAGAGAVTLGSGALTAGGDNTSTAFSGGITGTGGLTKVGTGVFTVSGANSYAGATGVGAGTLQAGAANTFAAGSAVTVAGGAALDLNSFNETIASLAGAGSVTLGSATLTAGSAASTVFSGGITGTGALIKTGSGTLTFTGTNSYGGGTTVAAGVLQGDTSSLQGAITDSAALVFNQAAAGTYAGAITGAGVVAKTGAGVLTLTGANAYGGATTLGAGILRAGAANTFSASSDVTVAGGAGLDLNGFNQTVASLAGAGGVTLGSATLTTGGDNASTAFAGGITGTGSLTKVGTGVFTLSGMNGYIGTTNVNAGVLKAGAANSFAGVSAVTVAGGATLDLNSFNQSVGSLTGAGDVTLGSAMLTSGADNTSTSFGGIISGAGGLTKIGTGAFTLTGLNSFTGGATLNGGELVAGADANLGGAGSSLNFTGGVLGVSGTGFTSSARAINFAGGGFDIIDAQNTFTVAQALAGGALVKLGAGTLVLTGANTYAGGTTVSAGTLQGDTTSLQGAILDSATVVFNQAANGVYAGVLSGSGALVKDNAGRLTLDGANTFNGTTTINDGILAVGDIAHPGASLFGTVNVMTGGELIGHGRINGTVNVLGGTVKPGGSIGTLTINGNFNLGASSTLVIELNPQANSTINVTGDAVLNGALVLNPDPGIYRAGVTYTFVTAGGTVTQAFSSAKVEGIGAADLNLAASGDVFTVTLVKGFASNIDLGSTRNQKAVAGALILTPTVLTGDLSSVVDVFDNLPTTGQMNAAFDQLGGEIYADFTSIDRSSLRGFLTGLGDQVRNEDPHADKGVWGRATGDFSQIGAGDGAAGVSSTRGGSVFGLDHAFGPDSDAGVSIGYTQSNFSLSGRGQHGEFNSVQFGLYGEQRAGIFFADAAASVSSDHGQGDRMINFGGLNREAKGSFTGMSGGAMATVGLRFDNDRAVIEPSVSMVYSHIRQGGLTEVGANGADLIVGADNEDRLESLASLKISQPITLAGRVLRPQLSVSWAHELNDVIPTRTESFTGTAATGFNTIGANPGRDSATVSAGAVYDITPRLSVSGQYDARFNARANDTAVTAAVRFAW